jgi:hypothetical protein
MSERRLKLLSIASTKCAMPLSKWQYFHAGSIGQASSRIDSMCGRFMESPPGSKTLLRGLSRLRQAKDCRDQICRNVDRFLYPRLPSAPNGMEVEGRGRLFRCLVGSQRVAIHCHDRDLKMQKLVAEPWGIPELVGQRKPSKRQTTTRKSIKMAIMMNRSKGFKRTLGRYCLLWRRR